METKILTHKEEIKVLESLMDSKFLGHGAARAVFELQKDVKAFLGIEDDRDFVVKLALGIGGFRQTQLEIKTFLEYGLEAPLAEIAAYGRYIEIMEAVDVSEDYRDFAGDGGDPYDIAMESYEEGTDEFERCYQDLQDAAEVIDSLEHYFGCTSDNGQLGRNADGDLVAYDYGFTTEFSSMEQVSDISDVICDTEECQRYLEGLIDLLIEEDDCLEDFENRFLHDENGDGTYTRYKAHILENNYENTWEYRNYSGLMERINDNDRIQAYQVYAVTYNYNQEEIDSELLEEHNTHCEYFIFKACMLEVCEWSDKKKTYYFEHNHFNFNDLDTCCRHNPSVQAYQVYRMTYVFGNKDPLKVTLIEEKIPADKKQEWDEKCAEWKN